MFHYPQNHEHQPAYMTPASTPAGRIQGARILSERINSEENHRGRSRDERMNDPYVEEDEDYILCSPVLPQKSAAATTQQNISNATNDASQLAHYGHRDPISAAAVDYFYDKENESFKERLDKKDGIIASLEEQCHWLEKRYLEVDSANVLLEQRIKSLERRCKVIEELNKSLELSFTNKEERIAVLQDAVGQLLKENEQRNDAWVHYNHARNAIDS